MALQDNCCSLVPYFKVLDGQIAAFEELCQRFIAKTKSESKCLYYGFSFDGNYVHCREGYEDAEGILTHLANVNSLLEESLQIAEIIRLEIHGPEAELAKLREPLSNLNPQFYVLKYGFRR